MRPESSKRFRVNEISFPASGYEPEGREFESLKARHSYGVSAISWDWQTLGLLWGHREQQHSQCAIEGMPDRAVSLIPRGFFSGRIRM